MIQTGDKEELTFIVDGDHEPLYHLTHTPSPGEPSSAAAEATSAMFPMRMFAGAEACRLID